MSAPLHAIAIAPSLLSADFGRLAEEIAAVEAAGADLLHVDVMDGRFVPNITLGPVIVKAIRRVTKLPLDLHLMIVEPEKYLEAFADAGADTINIHFEATPHSHSCFSLRNFGHINWQISGVTHGLYADLRFAGAVM